MPEPLRVVHYLNQFFAGFGGEEQANLPVQVLREPVGATSVVWITERLTTYLRYAGLASLRPTL